MAITYEIEIAAQPGIYEPQERSMKVCFAEPAQGVDKETGILLILAGYGDSMTSRVYTKMREKFADTYNLVTVQCDYFGYEYMQNDIPTEISQEMLERALSPAELDLLALDYEKYAHILKGKIFKQNVELRETKAKFNDMGLMQAMDNLRAVKVVMDILKDNAYVLNENRIYAYGFSHGAYLAYLCNALWRGGFTGIIDNSAYLVPYFLNKPREVDNVEEDFMVTQNMYFKASVFVEDEQILKLPFLYEAFENQAAILCIAGENDHMTPLEEKKEFLSQVEHAKVETITKYRVDRVNFFNTEHGVGADFLNLFRYAFYTFLLPNEKEREKKKEKHVISYENVRYETDLFSYEVRWEDGIPVLYREKKSPK